jgi:phage terminase small subunit
MTKKKLTDKQEMFCKEYLVDLNATQAAIRAGYSETSATEQGYENMIKPHIVERIQELMNKRSEKVGINAEDILNDILETRNTCKNNMMLEGENGTYIDNTALNGRNKANELLGKHLKLFTDKVEHSGEISMPTIKITK